MANERSFNSQSNRGNFKLYLSVCEFECGNGEWAKLTELHLRLLADSWSYPYHFEVWASNSESVSDSELSRSLNTSLLQQQHKIQKKKINRLEKVKKVDNVCGCCCCRYCCCGCGVVFFLWLLLLLTLGVVQY